MVNKKAEITSGQLVTTIIIVLGFIVVLAFLGIYNWNPTIDKESCHQSIVYRSSFNLGPIEASKNIPLKCKTEKICLSLSGDDCEQFSGLEKSDFKKIELKGNEVEIRTQIKDVIAESMYDCNQILGEGKLDFLPHDFEDNDYCLVCNRIVLDKKARELVKEISYPEIYSYLEKKQTSNGKSYLEYIYPGWTDSATSKLVFEKMKMESNDETLKNLDYENWAMNMEFEEGYIIMAEMSPKGTRDKWLKIGATVAIAAIGVVSVATIFTGVGPTLGIVAISLIETTVGTELVSAGYIYVYDHPNEEYNWVPPTIFPYNPETLKGLGCYSFEFAP